MHCFQYNIIQHTHALHQVQIIHHVTQATISASLFLANKCVLIQICHMSGWIPQQTAHLNCIPHTPCICTDTHMYRHTHVQTRTCTDTHMYRHAHVQTRTCTDMYRHTHMYTYVQTQTHTCTDMCRHTHTCADTHTHTHVQTCADTHAHVQTHTHM